MWRSKERRRRRRRRRRKRRSSSSSVTAEKLPILAIRIGIFSQTRGDRTPTNNDLRAIAAGNSVSTSLRPESDGPNYSPPEVRLSRNGCANRRTVNKNITGSPPPLPPPPRLSYPEAPSSPVVDYKTVAGRSNQAQPRPRLMRRWTGGALMT